MNLKQKAAEAAAYYEANPKVEAVILAGSVARGWDDRFSDIELNVLWREEPSDGDRLLAVKELGGELLSFYPYEDEEWSEAYTAGGVKFEISSFLTVTVEKVVRDVVMEADPCPEKQCLVASVNDGIPLAGNDLFLCLHGMAADYPDELQNAVLRQCIEPGSRWHNREALTARGDWLMLYSVVTDVQQKIMQMLFALNRMYVHHPAMKWQRKSLEKMTVKPVRAAERMDKVLTAAPEAGVKELESLLDDVGALVVKAWPKYADEVAKWTFTRPEQEGLYGRN
ncbi:DUF4037 domain-containing protein [Alteribacter natronophilus]|uniref:DUF4037 domain-containing protein n=1 Tax=Alteribacter natronophilus TaxID=2583810 RepID=UPI00110F3798|nr:DUF4037 domain-containing protein [Alteribacter natronophilus]TMW71447.1 DUF4037 domain-containing protein [Alteribacter natronophilus]